MIPARETTGTQRVGREGRKLSGKGGRCKLNSVAEEVITTGTCPVARCNDARRWITEKSSDVHAQGPAQRDVSFLFVFFSFPLRQEAWPLRDSNASTWREDRGNGRDSNYKLIINRARIYFPRLFAPLRQFFNPDDSSFVRHPSETRVFMKGLKRGN